MKEKNKILIYTDGSSLGNPGPGGYGIVMKTPDGKLEKHFSQGFKRTTNNRMELKAVIEALKKIKDKNAAIEIFSDSKYVVDSINKKWLNKWKNQNFAKTKNPDLWKDFLNVSKDLDLSIHWVKGHNNHKENEICDKLAVKAAKSEKQISDRGFEEMENPPGRLF